MSNENGARRRKLSQPTLTVEEKALEAIKQLAAKRRDCPEIDFGPEALMWLGQIFPPPRSVLDGSNDGWISTIEYLLKSGSFPGLGRLAFGLRGLQRGLTITELRATGGKLKGEWEQYEAKRAIVEAAEEIRRGCVKDEEWRARLKASGTSAAAINKYSQQLARDAPSLLPRSNYYLAWGDTDPAELIGLAKRLLKK